MQLPWKKNGGPPKIMDAASVEAMLCEARLNTKNARTLFKLLRLFFGQSYFESEVKRHEYFDGQTNCWQKGFGR
jgi:hypothetical protein